MDLLTTREAAELRRRSVRTLERERTEGRGPIYIIDGGKILYRRRDIEAYLDRASRRLVDSEPPRRGRPRKPAAAPVSAAERATP